MGTGYIFRHCRNFDPLPLGHLKMAKYSGSDVPKSMVFLAYLLGIVLAQQYWDAPFIVALAIAFGCTPFMLIPLCAIDWLILDRFRKKENRHYS